MTLNLDFKGHGIIIDVIDVFCAQLTRDLFVIAKFLSNLHVVCSIMRLLYKDIASRSQHDKSPSPSMGHGARFVSLKVILGTRMGSTKSPCRTFY